MFISISSNYEEVKKSSWMFSKLQFKEKLRLTCFLSECLQGWTLNCRLTTGPVRPVWAQHRTELSSAQP